MGAPLGGSARLKLALGREKLRAAIDAHAGTTVYAAHQLPHTAPWLPGVLASGVRILELIALVQAGFGDQLVVAHHLCFRTMTSTYGGWDFGHILRRVVPGMRAFGMTDDAIDAILVRTPARLLEFVAPGGAAP